MKTVVFFALSSLCLAGVHTAPLISSPWGQISGTDGTSPTGAPYSVYYSIPYALPPVGERRWAKPVAHPGYEAGRVFNGTSPKYMCPQKSFDPDAVKNMNEDCLWLNVFVPASASAGPRSVMIWIHGGSFIQGSADLYVPSELVTSQDVIVVVIQYRLNILGFLSSADDVIPGNFGLWDQVLAVTWVKDNIQAFGGDPDAITLFGGSAGAVSVGLHVLSPILKGVNFRAILQSGTPAAAWAVQEDPTQRFMAVANQTGCLTPTSLSDRMYYMMAGQKADHQRILACLRGKDVTTVMEALAQSKGREEPGLRSELDWAPTIDKDFIPRNPADLLGDPAYLSDVGATSRDIIVGMNNDESAPFLAPLILAANNANEKRDAADSELSLRIVMRQRFSNQIVSLYGKGIEKDQQRMKTLVDVLEFFYTQSVEGGMDKSLALVDSFSDISFTLPTVQFLEDLTKAADQLRSRGRPSSGRRYLYLFNHFPASRANLPVARGVYHADEVGYEFDRNGMVAAYPFDANDQLLASTFKTMISSFAKSGTPQLTIGQSGAPWPEFSLSEQQYLSLEPVPRVDRDLYGKRVSLWQYLLPSLVNSTAGINMGYWAMPWNQQQMYCPQGYSCSNNRMTQLPMRFVFKGKMSFFKLN